MPWHDAVRWSKTTRTSGRAGGDGRPAASLSDGRRRDRLALPPPGERAALVLTRIESVTLNGHDHWAHLKDAFGQLLRLRVRDLPPQLTRKAFATTQPIWGPRPRPHRSDHLAKRSRARVGRLWNGYSPSTHVSMTQAGPSPKLPACATNLEHEPWVR